MPIRTRALATVVARSLAPVSLALAIAVGQEGARITRVSWADVAPFAKAFEARGVTEATFPAYVEGLRATHARRVHEGDLDHLVFYLLQSTRFTTLPAIEPALSARELVDRLAPQARDAFLAGAGSVLPAVPDPVRARIAAFVRALDAPPADARLAYFRGLVRSSLDGRDSRDAIASEYLRVMRFVYEKEFVAQRSAERSAAVAELYRSRGLSTDTAVEAGFLVHLGLGVIKALEPDRRIRRVLIVGPGLDLAPRTALLEESAPESYQPWAVLDALLSLGLSRLDDLQVVAADINPRVVEHLRRASVGPPTLTLVSEIRETDTITLSDEYRDYFIELGRAVGILEGGRGFSPAETSRQTEPREAPGAIAKGHLRKSVRVGVEAARALQGEQLDIVTERIAGKPFDLVVATNILPYLDDASLMLALVNVSSMLSPGGVFLHNEARPLIREVSAAVGLPFEQSRHAIIASVRGSPAPLYDSVFLHRRRS